MKPKTITRTGNKGRGNWGLTLNKNESGYLADYVESFDTVTAAAISIGIDRNVLARVLLTSTASKDTIEKIRKVI